MFPRPILLAAAFGLLAACSDASDDASASPDQPVETSELRDEPFEVVDHDLGPDDEVTEGDGWELLDSAPMRPGRGRQAVLADDESRLDRAWDTYRMDDPPAVDLGPRTALLVTVPSECDFVLRDVAFGEVTADEFGWDTGEVRLTAQVEEPCDDPDATGRTLAFALDRDRVDVHRVFVSIGDGHLLGEDGF